MIFRQCIIWITAQKNLENLIFPFLFSLRSQAFTDMVHIWGHIFDMTSVGFLKKRARKSPFQLKQDPVLQPVAPSDHAVVEVGTKQEKKLTRPARISHGCSGQAPGWGCAQEMLSLGSSLNRGEGASYFGADSTDPQLRTWAHRPRVGSSPQGSVTELGFGNRLCWAARGLTLSALGLRCLFVGQ